MDENSHMINIELKIEDLESLENKEEDEEAEKIESTGRQRGPVDNGKVQGSIEIMSECTQEKTEASEPKHAIPSPQKSNKPMVIPKLVIENVSRRHKVNIQLHLDLNYQIIKKRNTIYTKFMSPKAIQFMYRYVWKNRLSAFLTQIGWVVITAIIFCFLVGMAFVPTLIYVPLQLIFTIHFLACHFAFINLGILCHIVQSFNFWYLFFHLLVSTACLIHLWGGNLYVFMGCIHGFSSFLYLTMIDSYMFSKPKPVKIMCFVGMLSLVTLFGMLKFSPYIAHLQYKSVDYGDIHLINPLSQAADSIGVLAVYALRVLLFKLIQDRSSMILLEDNYKIDMEKKKKKGRLMQSILRSFAFGSSAMKKMQQRRKIEANQQQEENSSNEIKEFVPVQPGSGVKEMRILNGKGIKIPEEVKQNPNDYLVFGIYKQHKITLNRHHTLYNLYLQDKFPSIQRIMGSKFYIYSGTFINVTCPFIYLTAILIGDKFATLSQVFTSFWMALSISIFITQIALTANILMLKRMFLSFDYWYVTWLSIQVLVSGGILVKFDWRFILWIWYFIGAQWYMFIDSFSPKLRKLTYFSVIGISCSIFTGFSCKFGFGSMFRENVIISWNDNDLLDVRSIFSGSVFSWSLFMSHSLYGFWKNPSRSEFVTRMLRISTVQSFIESNEED